MIRLTKQADYAIVLLIRMAEVGHRASHSARDLSQEVHLPLPIVSKVLKTLARKGLLVSHRGVNGGYSLAFAPEDVSVARIIAAIEGPIAITECQSDSECAIQRHCSSRQKWNRINQLICHTLDDITLAMMAHPEPAVGSLSRPRGGAAVTAGASPAA